MRDAVQTLMQRYPDNRYLVTSRIVGYADAPLPQASVTHVTVLPLDDDQIRTFINNWYTQRERDPRIRTQQIQDLTATIEREPRIQALARNPLLLTIIALVHRIEAELPHERVKLYDKCVGALVDTWEDVKGLTLAEKQRPFYQQRRRILERLAFDLQQGREAGTAEQTIRRGDLELRVTQILMQNRKLSFADDPDGAREEAQAFVRLVQGRTGLLVERGEGVFTFAHLTFQEYLAACDLEKRVVPQGTDALWVAVAPMLHLPHWQEVLLLLLGRLNTYDQAATTLLEHILAAGTEDPTEPLLHRHLLLAARALADQIEVDRTLQQQILPAPDEPPADHAPTTPGLVHRA